MVNDEVIEKFVNDKSIDLELFDKEELEIIDYIIKHFRDVTTPQLIELSHKEIGWRENLKKKSLISYQKYADVLQV